MFFKSVYQVKKSYSKPVPWLSRTKVLNSFPEHISTENPSLLGKRIWTHSQQDYWVKGSFMTLDPYCEITLKLPCLCCHRHCMASAKSTLASSTPSIISSEKNHNPVDAKWPLLNLYFLILNEAKLFFPPSSACLPALFGNADFGCFCSQVCDFPCVGLQWEPVAKQSLLQVSEWALKLSLCAEGWLAPWLLRLEVGIQARRLVACSHLGLLQEIWTGPCLHGFHLHTRPLDSSEEQSRVFLQKVWDITLSTLWGLSSKGGGKKRRRKASVCSCEVSILGAVCVSRSFLWFFSHNSTSPHPDGLGGSPYWCLSSCLCQMLGASHFPPGTGKLQGWVKLGETRVDFTDLCFHGKSAGTFLSLNFLENSSQEGVTA